jgi:hypothetical protein
VSFRGFNHTPEELSLNAQRYFGRWPELACVSIDGGLSAIVAVFFTRVRANVRQIFCSVVRKQVNPEFGIYVTWQAFARMCGLIIPQELVGCVLETSADFLLRQASFFSIILLLIPLLGHYLAMWVAETPSLN